MLFHALWVVPAENLIVGLNSDIAAHDLYSNSRVTMVKPPSDRRNVPARIRIGMSAILHPASKIVNKFKTIDFSGGTMSRT
jgi:hypothetical protein